MTTAPSRPVTTRDAFLAGCRAMLPWLVGIVPFGLVIGVTVARSSVDHLAGWATGPTIFAGGAQLATIDLLDRGAAPVVIVVTVLVINSRLLLYGGSIGTYWRGTGPGFRVLASYLLIDPTYAVGMDGYRDGAAGGGAHARYLGAGVTLWLAWLTAMAVGASAGATLPAALHLEYVVPMYLVAEVARTARTRPAVVAAVVAAVVSVAGDGIPLHGGLAVAISAGIAAATCVATEVRP